MAKKLNELDSFRRALVEMEMFNLTEGPCPHCGKMITKEEWDTVVGSLGGAFNTPKYGIVGAHGECYYKHEATEEWRASHQKYAPKE